MSKIIEETKTEKLNEMMNDERMFTYTEKNTYCNQCNEE
jgi:hypothetical protein